MPLILNRKTFWNLYHKKFDPIGSTSQITVDSLNAILDLFEKETRLRFISWFSYILATAYHETGINGNHFLPVKEGRERPGAKGRKNQDRYWFTGFYGRGLIQTTWETGYRALGKLLGVGELFVQNPDLLLQIKWAYESIVAGMVNGIYRKDAKGRHTLERHLKADDESLDNYTESREIVNGDKTKNGLMIARYANNFEEILLAARISDTVDPISAPVVAPASTDAQPVADNSPAAGTSDNTPEEGKDNDATPPPASSDTVIEVDQAVAKKDTVVDKITEQATWLSGKVMAIPTAVGSFFLGILAWFQSAPVHLVIGFFGSGAMIGTVYIAFFMWLKRNREKDQNVLAIEKERTMQIREQHAHEITLKQMDSAMSRDLNTVVVKPLLLDNSEK